jgi:hypothetical protein
LVEHFTLTSCVDCGITKALGKDELTVASVAFRYGSEAIKIWKYDKHHVIVVNSRPERVFLSCQESQKLWSDEGIAAILNFVEHIKPEQEVASV